MESLNLNTLANSLPNANNLANSEQELLNNFKAAALSITTLYRSSRTTSKRAYNAGYGAACQDLLLMIQQGVSVGGVGLADSNSMSSKSGGVGNEMTIGKVMDWIEARLEAVKSREEEEDEDEERERVRGGTSNAASAPTASKSTATTKARSTENIAPISRPKDQPVALPPTPHSPPAHLPAPPSSLPPSPSPPSTPLHTTTTRPTHHLPLNRPSKSRVTFPTSNLPSADVFKFGPGLEEGYGNSVDLVGAGAKRRHAVMMMLDSANGTPSTVDVSIDSDSSPGNASHTNVVGSSATPCTRRRTRSVRGQNHAHSHGHGGNGNGHQSGAEAMDVEEDGRERKRVARR